MDQLGHIALVVSDLQAAETFYQRLFNMSLVGREAPREDGLWYTLPTDKGWDDAAAEGIALRMVALRRGAFVLALFQGHVAYGQVFAIGLSVSDKSFAEIRAGLPSSVQVETDEPNSLVFRDAYGITWQIRSPEFVFLSNGEEDGRWLEL